MKTLNRRDFIAASTAAGWLAHGGPAGAQDAAPKRVGANEKVVLGFIGVGGQGTNAHVKGVKEHAGANNVVQAAVCDVSKTRAATGS